MRIIAGEYRSRKLKSVPGLDVRPTPDRLRETLFNVLALRIHGSIFMDAYAGSGAVGLEAYSRGAKRVIIIEKRQAAIEVIRENIATLGIGREAVSVVRGQASVLLANYPADIVFIDPPYDLTDEYDSSLNAIAGTPCELAIAQHASRLTLAEAYGRLHKTRTLKHGDNSLSFYS
jgi:16S rRNA (guanine(966)-N(2))-methyltransferase RsmD